MSECKSTQKTGVVSPSRSSIGNILKILQAIFSVMKLPADTLPPPLLILGARLRPGLSARDMAARVISRFSESDAVNGEIFQEGNNVMTALMVITMEEIVNAIQTEAKITTVIEPGSMIINASGGNAGGPITVVGTIVAPCTPMGVVQ